MRGQISMTKLADPIEDAMGEDFNKLRYVTSKETATRITARVDGMRKLARKLGVSCTCSKTRAAQRRKKGAMLPPTCQCRPMTASERSRRR